MKRSIIDELMKKRETICPVCGMEIPGASHKCDKKRLARMDVARKGAETRLENYGTLRPKKPYGDILKDGFDIMRRRYE